MSWQLRDRTYRQAIQAVVSASGVDCALCGTVGVQLHLAAVLGIDKVGPPSRAIEAVSFATNPLPATIANIPVVQIDPLGFDASVKAQRVEIDLDGERFPVASPEHTLGLLLAAPDLTAATKWACFILMRSYADRLDLEQTRGFLKRCEAPERQALLAELAYLAA